MVQYSLAMSRMTSGRQYKASNGFSGHALRKHDGSTQAKSFVSI
jgi:hypothetical protein